MAWDKLSRIFLYLTIPTFIKQKLHQETGHRTPFYSSVLFQREVNSRFFRQITKKAEDFIATSYDIYGCETGSHVKPFLNSLIVSRKYLPEWIMKHPAWCNILLHVKLIYQVQSCQSNFKQNRNLKAGLNSVSFPCKAPFSIVLKAISRSPNHIKILPFFVLSTLRFKDNITEIFTFRNFMLNLPVSQFVRLITTSTNTLKKQTGVRK